jgi:type I restriction enzyme S subunit
MSSKKQATAAMEAVKPALVPKLRFPEFRETEGWESGKVDDLVDTVTSPKKLPTASYGASGAFAIIDQSQSDICGWTDDNEALIRDDLPLIVFGDHTCILKLVDRPFAQGADGIKILKSRSKVWTPFIFQFLSHRPVVTEEYKRHFSILKEKTVFFPDCKSGEQQKIAECLSSVDELIAVQARKVDALKTHKKGLMQQLFPREGETQPRLRFPEFRDAGKWQKMTLGQAATFYNGRAYKQEELLESGKYPVLRVGNFFTNNTWYYSSLELEETKYCESGDLLYAWSASFGPRVWRGEKSIYHYHIWKVAEQLGIDKQFLFVTLENETERMKAKTTNGLGIMHITKGAIESWETAFPTLVEQIKISGWLMNLDTIVNAETRKLKILAIHKSGLMQQLFPILDDTPT